MNIKFPTSLWNIEHGRNIDSSFFDFSNVTEPYKNGYYKFLDSNKIFTGSHIGGKHGYQVKVNLIFLVDGSNSDLTYNLIRTIKHNKLGTIIGAETGGDGRGVNTGSIVKLRLPNSKIEVDIPLIGTYYNEGKPGGVQPDVKVQVPALPFLYEKDFYLNAALEYINKK
jgi:C-terminal processing protease CtpA/Prc